MNYYESIYEISRKKDTNDELRKKVNNPQGYSQEAVDAAKKILEERGEYPDKEEKMKYREHDYLAKMARDIHTIKNIILFCFVLGIIGFVLMLFGM